jgi:hypothetical protein
MRIWTLVSACAFLVAACSEDSTSTARPSGTGGTAGGATTSTGSGATGGAGTSGGMGGTGGATTGTGAGGGTGGAGAAGGGGAGGAGASDGGESDAGSVDASRPDIIFGWPETVPGLKCKAGRYQGTFTGTYASSAAIIPLPIPVAGDIDLTLVQTATGEIFEISNGKLSGLANLIFPFSADLVGKLNCKTSKLDPTTSLKNGNYIVLGAPFAFEGPFLGDYDKIAVAFVNGTWDVKEPNPIYGGTGAWSASWVGSGTDAAVGDAPQIGDAQVDVGEGGQ